MRLPFTHLHKEEWLRLADAAAMAAFLIVLIGVLVAAAAYRGSDFPVFYAVARIVTTGGNPYDPAIVSAALRQLGASSGAVDPNLPPYFYYPPWLCLILAPLAAFSFETARLVWLGVNASMLACGARLLVLAFGWHPRPWQWAAGGLAVLYPFGWVALGSAQISVFVFFSLAVAAYYLARTATWRDSTGTAALVGAAICLSLTKPQDGLLAALVLSILFWQRGRSSAPILAIACAGVLTLVSSLFVPNWWSAIDLTSLAANLTVQSQSSGAVAARVNATLVDWLAGFGVIGVNGVNGAPATVIWGGVILASTFTLWRGIRAGLSEGYLLGLATVVTFLITPYAFEYDYVVMVPALLWSLWRLGSCGLAELLVRLAALSIVYTSHLWGRWMSDAYWIPLILFTLFTLELVTGALPTTLRGRQTPLP